MIPGAWEPRRPSEALPSTTTATAKQPAATEGGSEQPPEIQRPGMSNWMELSIFTATLLAAMWLAMTVFFESPSGLVI
jgi:hypothetical protein